jgi:hypothetical protein
LWIPPKRRNNSFAPAKFSPSAIRCNECL